jgi:diketogulonate reductase-like aldo/keto reductase
VNLFDTAQAYGFGRAEELLGKALWSRVRREDVVIATKGGLRMEGDQLLRDASSAWLRRGVDESLRILGTDYIDLYQLHWPDLHTPADDWHSHSPDFTGDAGGQMASALRGVRLREAGTDARAVGPLVVGYRLAGRRDPR